VAARLFLVAAPVVVLIAAVVTLLILLVGAPGTGVETTVTSATLATDLEGDGGSLVVEQDGTALALVVLRPAEQGGVVLGIPGSTLLKVTTAFKTVADLHGAGDPAVLAEAVAEALTVPIGPIASVEWASLSAAVGDSDDAGPLSGEVVDADETARATVDAVAVLLGRITDGGADPWQGLHLRGDAEGLEAGFVSAAADATGSWTTLVLPGRVREGEGFQYYEPDLDRLAAALSGGGPGAGITIVVENGSGMIEAAERAGQLLEPLGFTMEPFRNAEDFPNVAHTRILHAADTGAEAGLVKDLLGAGMIEADESLEAGHLVVVVGKDFVLPSSSGD